MRSVQVDDGGGEACAGFSLIETMISVGLLSMAAVSVVQMFALATHANVNAKAQTSATLIAEQKMEQLRSLTWEFTTGAADPTTSDTTTNLAHDPPGTDGGGLSPSPAGALVTSAAGYHDYVNESGATLGSGGAAPAGAIYIRRWAVTRLPGDPDHTLVLQVGVTPMSREGTRDGVVRLRDEARLVTIKTRQQR
jgi:type II secretory pathway pseudopilin PulG